MLETELGRRIYSQNAVLRGNLSDLHWESFLVECTGALGMDPAAKAAVFHYPLENGKGGTGLTIFQPITTSFMVIDVWPDFDGAYLHISSCKKFHIADLVETIRHFHLAMEFSGAREELKLA
jgi:hypothetical protein